MFKDEGKPEALQMVKRSEESAASVFGMEIEGVTSRTRYQVVEELTLERVRAIYV